MRHAGIGKLLAGKVAYALHHSGLSEKVGHRDRFVLLITSGLNGKSSKLCFCICFVSPVAEILHAISKKHFKLFNLGMN